MSVLTIVPILLAGIVSSVIGFAWYHPHVFGNIWMRLSGVTPETVERGKNRMHVYATAALCASILAAYVIHSLEAGLGIYDMGGAMKLGFLLWAGFVVPALAGIVLWEQKSVSLYAINAGYWLVAFVAMAVILVF